MKNLDQIVLTHTCRESAELRYGHDLMERTKQDPLVGDAASQSLVYLGSTTQEDSPTKGRITQLIDDGTLFSKLELAAFDPEYDRIMLCGSLDMISDLKTMLEERGFDEGSQQQAIHLCGGARVCRLNTGEGSPFEPCLSQSIFALDFVHRQTAHSIVNSGTLGHGQSK